MTSLTSVAPLAGRVAIVTGASSGIDEATAVELGQKKVRVSAIEPGIVGTQLQSRVTDTGVREWLAGSKETMRWLTAEDIARTVGFLASQPARVNLQQVTIMPTGEAS